MPLSVQLPISLDREDPRPLPVQLAGRIRERITGGILVAGDRLPSSRTLSGDLRIGREVVTLAYEQLAAEGWLVGRHGSGTYVAAAAGGPPTASLPAGPLGPHRSADRPPRDLDRSLQPGRPWTAGIGSALWRRIWRSMSDTRPDSAPLRAGDDAFRRLVAGELLRHRGVAVARDRVLATSGTTAGLIEAVVVLTEPGDRIAVEDPGYPRAVGAIQATGRVVVPVPVDPDRGLRVEKIPPDVRAVYCTPAHQYPLGATLDAGRRVELVDRARTEGFWIIEDDYDGELRFDVTPLPLLAALGPDVVLHLGTASKILTPTFGCGWLVAPAEVVAAVLAHRVSTGTAPGLPGQRAMTAMAATGDLARHLRRARIELGWRRTAVRQMLQSAGLTVIGDDAGSFLVVPLADPEHEGAVIAEAADGGLEVDGVQRHYAAPQRAGERAVTAGLVLGYAGAATRSDLSSRLDLVCRAVRSTGSGG